MIANGTQLVPCFFQHDKPIRYPFLDWQPPRFGMFSLHGHWRPLIICIHFWKLMLDYISHERCFWFFEVCIHVPESLMLGHIRMNLLMWKSGHRGRMIVMQYISFSLFTSGHGCGVLHASWLIYCTWSACVTSFWSLNPSYVCHLKSHVLSFPSKSMDGHFRYLNWNSISSLGSWNSDWVNCCPWVAILAVKTRAPSPLRASLLSVISCWSLLPR